MKTIQASLTVSVLAATLSMSGLALADHHMGGHAQTDIEQAGEAVSDTWITTKVKSALLADDATPGMNIEVETEDGVVSLSGAVMTEAQKVMAIESASSIEGVKSVMADGLKVAE